MGLEKATKTFRVLFNTVKIWNQIFSPNNFWKQLTRSFSLERLQDEQKKLFARFLRVLIMYRTELKVLVY